MYLSQKQRRKAIREGKQTNLAKRKRLERAAPELLKACKAFVNGFDRGASPPLVYIIKKAKQAIASVEEK